MHHLLGCWYLCGEERGKGEMREEESESESKSESGSGSIPFKSTGRFICVHNTVGDSYLRRDIFIKKRLEVP